MGGPCSQLSQTTSFQLWSWPATACAGPRSALGGGEEWGRWAETRAGGVAPWGSQSGWELMWRQDTD